MTDEPTQADEDCEPCKLGVLIGIGKYVCEQNVQGDDKRECDDLYEKVVVGEIPVKDFISKVRGLVKNPDDLRTLDSVSEIAVQDKVADVRIESPAQLG